MSSAEIWAAGGLVALGAWHGLNPGMGWLFAVALGMQEGRERAVWRALPPLAAGHALAVGAAVAAAALLGRAIPLPLLTWGVAIALVAMGASRLIRARHPRYGGMQIGGRELTVWSFLMATAHGAGLMVVPLVLAPAGARAAEAAGHAAHAAAGGGQAAHGAHELAMATLAGPGLGPVLVTLLHTAGYLVVLGLVAALVYRRFGVRWIRTGWVNLDLLWGVALILTGAATPLLS